jgi:hypothetical protein
MTSASGSAEAEDAAPLGPAQRQLRMLDQHRRGEASRLSPFEDGRGDVGGEVSKAQKPGEIGAVQPFALGQIAEFGDLALRQFFR